MQPGWHTRGCSQYSTECYRDFFVDEALVPFMSRSVSLLEDLAGDVNDINLTRRGYCFFAASDEGIEAPLGIGALSAAQPSVRQVATLCAFQLSRSSPTGFSDGITGFDLVYGTAKSTEYVLTDGQERSLPCDAFVNAAGAWMETVNQHLAAPKLPLKNEGVLPETAPFMVWRDKVAMNWDEEMKEFLMDLDDTSEGGIVNSSTWLAPQPGGQHMRPAGNGRVIMLWEHLHRHMTVPQAESLCRADDAEDAE
eukprot:Skav212382  [mRNA]  locus=scaffold45:23237:29277:- [translate_table: standard]